jgi:hypothetical protein
MTRLRTLWRPLPKLLLLQEMAVYGKSTAPAIAITLFSGTNRSMEKTIMFIQRKGKNELFLKFDGSRRTVAPQPLS